MYIVTPFRLHANDANAETQSAFGAKAFAQAHVIHLTNCDFSSACLSNKKKNHTLTHNRRAAVPFLRTFVEYVRLSICRFLCAKKIAQCIIKRVFST